MKSDYKPGDVALIRHADSEVVAMRGITSWNFADPSPNPGFSTTYDHSGRCEPIRPLVVIDPEDREQVERLNDAQDAEYARRGIDVENHRSVDVGVMQAALRAFANPTPPRPEEPTGLGAVVEDAFGHTFIRLSTTWFNINEDQHCTWDHVAARRVLSAGVIA